MRARREKSSSTLSPERADTSTETGIWEAEAQREACSLGTWRPSGEVLAVCLVGRVEEGVRRELVVLPPPPASEGKKDCRLETLEGVSG